MKCGKKLVNILVIMIIFISLCDARGGRRGGSFGGLFGSWRKYKKPINNGGGNTRRIVSSSPVHTPITKAWHENKRTSNSDKFYKNIKGNNNLAALPMGGSYYQNTATLPGNAIYVAQPPPRGAEFGDFLTGYLTGRLLTMGYSTPHNHVTHIYRENPSSIIETASKSNTSSQANVSNDQQTVSLGKEFNAPLMEFSTTTEIYSSKEDKNNTTEEPANTNVLPVSPFGFICVPILLNETNAKGEELQNEKTVCYPAPAPPLPQKEMKSKPVEIAGDIIEP